MEEYKKKLELHYSRFDVPEEMIEEFGDEYCTGDCWKFCNPESVDFWSIAFIPWTHRIGFINKFKNETDTTLPNSNYEEVYDISEGPPNVVLIKCLLKDDPKHPGEYKYTYVLELMETKFNIQQCCISFMGSQYGDFLKELEVQIETGRWKNKDGGPLRVVILGRRLQ